MKRLVNALPATYGFRWPLAWIYRSVDLIGMLFSEITMYAQNNNPGFYTGVHSWQYSWGFLGAGMRRSNNIDEIKKI
jgi:hypothetical protein